MKATKKIVGATCALVAAVALSAGSTFAWFASNTNVTASGMNVTAKSESTYLAIAQTISGGKIGNGTTINLSSVTGTVLPVSFATSEIKNEAGDTTLVTANKWYKANGTATDNGAAVKDSKEELTISEESGIGSASGSDYYVYTEFYVGLAEGSSATTKGIQADVTFSAATESNLNKSFTVAIDYDAQPTISIDQYYVYGAATGPVTKYSSAYLAASVTTTPVKVKVYLYFDGEDTNCTTANAINLDAITVNLKFTVNEDLHST